MKDDKLIINAEAEKERDIYVSETGTEYIGAKGRYPKMSKYYIFKGNYRGINRERWRALETLIPKYVDYLYKVIDNLKSAFYTIYWDNETYVKLKVDHDEIFITDIEMPKFYDNQQKRILEAVLELFSKKYFTITTRMDSKYSGYTGYIIEKNSIETSYIVEDLIGFSSYLALCIKTKNLTASFIIDYDFEKVLSNIDEIKFDKYKSATSILKYFKENRVEQYPYDANYTLEKRWFNDLPDEIKLYAELNS